MRSMASKDGTTSSGSLMLENPLGSLSIAGRPHSPRNCSAFRTQVRHVVAGRSPSWVVVQCEAMTDIDVSAARMLEQLDRELNASGVHIAFRGDAPSPAGSRASLRSARNARS